ncbi:MAG: PEP-CTERM system histidine kinase PrsK [Gammaproteobacteria bacterium]|nr:PEP-CTERM system histidine kinase PrsK [Gammaproteobacteria bacterium]
MIYTNEIGAFGYAVALAVYLLLTILLLSGWRRRDQSRLPALATAISMLWAVIWLSGFLDVTRTIQWVMLVEWLRGLAWLLATYAILREISKTSLARFVRSVYGMLVALLVVVPVGLYLLRGGSPPVTLAWMSGGYVLSLLIVVTAEQLYRNARSEVRSSVNYLCVAIAGVFIFDLALYGFVVAGIPTGPEYWAARGFVNALFATPLALGIWRRSRQSSGGQMPKQMVFYSFGLTIIAIYVVLIFVGHYYVREFGQSWGVVGSIVLVVAAIGAAVTLFVSNSLRARARVLLMKSFFQFKYDYRKEWLRFIATLSESGLENVAATAVRAVAQIVNSPGGLVLVREQGSSRYLPLDSWSCDIPGDAAVAADSPLGQFVRARQWVIDLEEMKQSPQQYGNLRLEDWLQRDPDWWLIVPLFLGKRLYGLIILRKPRVVPALNFEDHDLLRTVGRHVGMHISQSELDKRMAESSQFGAYNRLTAFLMHDLNNLIAQQSLVVENAEKHRHNPKFVDDAIDTIANSVARMKRLMEQLTSRSKTPTGRRTDLRETLTQSVEHCMALKPIPSVSPGDTPIPVNADPERLCMVFEHLIRNAQDATDDNGEISIDVTVAGKIAQVAIRDTGTGMAPDFVRERLFRPFDSTKGSGSMGIGAYQARDYIRSLNGQLDVTSEVGSGTTFNVKLPLAD